MVLNKISALCFISLLVCPAVAYSQDNKSLRDSLAIVVENLSYHPDSTDLRLKKAGLNLQLGQWGYALDEYDHILSRDSKNVAALYYRAFTNEKLHRYNFARLDYENLLTIVPGNFEAQIGLALLNQKDGHQTEAYDQINLVVSQFPDSAVAYAARGGIEAERGLLELAEYDYGKAIFLDRRNIDYRLNRIDILLKLKRKDDAKEALDDLVRMGIPRPSLKELYIKCRK